MVIKDKGTNQNSIRLLCWDGVKLPLTWGVFAPDITFFANTLFRFTVYSYYRDLNNKLNRKYVEEIIIGEYHVCFSLVFAFPFCDVGYV